MIAGQSLVQAKQISVTYRGGVRATEQLDFEIPAGQFVSIVGPSGCGKSTLLRLIAGLVRPSTGDLTVAGQSPIEARRNAARLAFVFQDATLLPWRSVWNNVLLPLELHKSPHADREALVQRVLAMVGLTDFSRRFPNELSGGMRMRVSLARALVTEPQLLLLDEPFAALDDITRQTLNEELMRLWAQRHWTGIFVTHNIAEAVYLSQRVLVMSARPGRIVADIAIPFGDSRPPELRTEPAFGKLCGEVMSRLRGTSS